MTNTNTNTFGEHHQRAILEGGIQGEIYRMKGFIGETPISDIYAFVFETRQNSVKSVPPAWAWLGRKVQAA